MKKFDANKFLTHINERWINKTCPLCGSSQWTVSDKVYELREYQDGNIVIGGDTNIFPVVPIVCLNCGNSVFINPIIANSIKEQGE